MPADLVVRGPYDDDVPEVARLFVDAFAGHPVAALTAKLQHRFIAVHAAAGVMLVASDARTGRVIGFAIGGRRDDIDRARRRFIAGNALALTLRAITPRGAALRAGRTTSRKGHSSPSTGCELRYLAVAPSERGRGVGSALLAALEDRVFAGRPYFVWVLAERPAALKFYARHGFDREQQIDGHVRLIKQPG